MLTSGRMSTVVGFKHDLFAGGGVPPRIVSHLPLYDGERVTTARKSPVEARASSSIGRNSDYSSAGSGGEESGEAEVQSALKGPLDTMDELELGLPICSQASNFHRGKSKSLSSLHGDSSPWSPAQDLAASSNRKRKKQQALLFRGNPDSDTNTPPKAPPSHGRLLKRLAEANQSMPTLGTPVSAAAASSSSGSNSSATSFEEYEDSVSGS